MLVHPMSDSVPSKVQLQNKRLCETESEQKKISAAACASCAAFRKKFLRKKKFSARHFHNISTDANIFRRVAVLLR